MHRGISDALAIARTQDRACHLQRSLCAQLPRDAFVVVVGDDMANLMRNDACQLVLVAGDGENAGVKAHIAAG